MKQKRKGTELQDGWMGGHVLKEENRTGEGCGGEKLLHLAGQGWDPSHHLFASDSHLVLVN